MITGSLQKQDGKWFAVLNLYDFEGKRKQKWFDTGFSIKGNKKNAESYLESLKARFNAMSVEEVAVRCGLRGKKALEDFLPEELSEAIERLPSASKDCNPLFADFIKEWLQITKPTIERATFVSYENMINARIDKHFRKLGVKLTEVEPKHIRTLYEKIFKDGYTANTVIHYHAVIRKCLEYALKNEMVVKNVADLVDRPKKNKYIAKHYTIDELQELFDITSDDPISVPIQLAAYYGLRRSEVLGLRWSAVDFQKKTISVNHKVTEETENGKTIIYCEDTLKTKSSYRTLPLIPAVEELLKKEREKQQMFKKVFKKAYSTKYSDYICVDQMGMLFRPNYITEHFRWLISKYNFKTIRFHDLRHSCASLLLAQNVPMKAIQEWMGHSTFATTADIYSHLDFNSKLESAGAIASAFGAKLTATV